MTRSSPTTDRAQAQAATLASALGVDYAHIEPRHTVAPAAWARIGVLGVLFIVLHLRQLNWAVTYWMTNSNWQFCFLIPLFSLYLLYIRRQEILSARRKASWTGLVIMVLAFLGEPFSVLFIKNFWLSGICMVVMLFGLVLYLGGWDLMRYVWLPVLYLALAIPWPEAVYSAVAYPLQERAAAGSVWTLQLFGVDIERVASNIKLISRSGVPRDLTVVEACAGMRLLVAFFALGVAIAYLENRPMWQRVILVLAGIPIAILCNVLRVTLTATAFYFDRVEWGEGVLHAFTGMIMLLPAFAMLFALSWLLQRLFVEVEEDESD